MHVYTSVCVGVCRYSFQFGFISGNLEVVGKCLSEYWQQKKVMAPGCEPEAVGRMMDALRPHTLGMSMAGAGGGGFLYLLTKEPNAINLVQDILSKVQVDCHLLSWFSMYARI